MERGLTVQEAADRTGLTAHTIRYYERIGLIPSIERATNGHRCYSGQDIEWIEFLKCLRSTGMPIAEMLRYVELQHQGDSTFPDRLALLQDHRRRIKARIQDLQDLLARVEWKIDYYEKVGTQQVKES